MTSPARHAPTPAAVLTYVGLGTLVVTYALMSWDDALNQAAAGEYAWPLDPAILARDSAGWALEVTLWCAVAWVASVRQTQLGHPRRVPALATAFVGTWTLLAWWSVHVALTDSGWYVPWPGPVLGAAYAQVDGPFEEYSVVLRPGAATPLALVAAVLVVVWFSRRHTRTTVLVADVRAPSRRAYATGCAVLGPPAVAALAAAVLLQTSFQDESLTALQRGVDGLVTPGAGLVLVMVSALLVAGTGRAGWLVLAVVQVAVAGPFALQWWAGGADETLAAVALGTLAVALAAAVHPVASAVSRLDVARSTAVSVAEGSDADDRARA
ncbi:hypothetical protein [Cellulomonas sp.]|uniref:hypothetical protein n=1 Tax=Cellulomonas sp. TaxID=40001 RepID=UPI003BAA109C